MTRARIVVLASGGGTNLQTLIDLGAEGGSETEVVSVLSNRRESGALDRARRAGIPAGVVAQPADADALLGQLEAHRPDVVVLAGYLKLVPDAVVRTFAGRMVNIHPALLPAFGGRGMYGEHVHRAVLASGVRVTGATVHLVDTEFDRGPILAQWPVPVLTRDSVQSLAARVLAVEHALLPPAVRAVARAVRRGESPRPLEAGGEAFTISPQARIDLCEVH